MCADTRELGSLLLGQGLISPSQLQEALTEQGATRERVGEILCRRGYVSAEDILGALSVQLGHRRFDPARDEVQHAALSLLPYEFARRHGIQPVRLDDGLLVVAMADPLDIEARDNLRRIAERSGRRLEILLATPEILERTREASYGLVESSRSVTELIDKVVDEAGGMQVAEEEADEAEAQRRAQEAGTISLVDQIIGRALQERATDIHIEPQEKGLLIRYRVDGILYEALSPPRAVYTGTVSRIKIMSNMDIAERRMAQDGRFTYRRNGHDVDVRVSAIPTIHGEKLVLRLLDKSGFNFSLRDLGFSQADFEAFERAIHHPYGMVLLSGPTGSGKTTTLYASLLELRHPGINITTIEDPAEYKIGGINQVQVNERKQVSFANALRSFLRQDPDVIMVGEIRDHDTADIAIRAALTGHMVFSTIHANDAPTTATRLVSMGAEPFMAASALTMVAAQRLVRRNCPHCLAEYRPADEVLFAAGEAGITAGASRPRLLKGAGCVACKGRGYLGRVAIVERMMLTPGLRQLVADNRPADEIRKLALQEGMVTLRQSGLQKAREGSTTIEEVLRVCLSDD
ncbi:MAG: type II/IV secretion system protein [Candidatus Eisenbacteria bacterium]|nr:type II/IV secretion system protein [Candidatus Eisenbacteria bacterium]